MAPLRALPRTKWRAETWCFMEKRWPEGVTRYVRIVEVAGSSPVTSTLARTWQDTSLKGLSTANMPESWWWS